MPITIIKEPINKSKLKEMAEERFGDMVKGAVDVEKEIAALGGELHIDEEVALIENERSNQNSVWGINLYPDKEGDDFIEFDSMINIKPQLGNRTRDVNEQTIFS